MKQKLLLVPFFLTISLLFLHPINASDFFHHIVTGRDIVQTWHLPYTDTHTYTAYGKAWIAHSWGSGVIFYLVYLFSGYTGINILFAIIGTLTGIFVYKIARRLEAGILLALTITWLASGIISLRWPSRPEVFAPLFISALLFILLKYKKLHWILIPLFWAWGIIYGSSAFLGIGILLIFLVTKKVFSKRSLIIAVSCFVASLLNGYGFSSFFYIFIIPKIASHVGEWLPLTAALNPNQPEVVLFYQYTALVYTLFTLMTLVLIVIVLLKKRKDIPKQFFFLLLGSFVLIPFYASRFISITPILALPCILVALMHLPQKVQKIFFFFILLLATGATVARFHTFTFGFGVEDSPFQPKLITFLKEKHISGNIFATQELGGFLSWEIPDAKVFSDTRDDLFIHTDLFDKLAQVDAGKIPLGILLDSYDTNIIIADLGNGSSYRPFLYDSQWDLVYVTDGYMVLTKNVITKQFHLKSYAALDPLKIPPVKMGKFTQAEKELRSLLASSPHSDENIVRLLELLLTEKKNKEALTLLKKISPTGFYGSATPLITLDTNLLFGKVYLANTMCTDAKNAFSRSQQAANNQMIFFPDRTLPSQLNYYLGDYYYQCEKNNAEAAKYYRLYDAATGNPLEKLHIEQKLQIMNNN